MSEDRKITCDGCERDITYTVNSVDYRLALTSESKPPWYLGAGMTGGAVHDMMVYPSIDKPLHFCDLDCLRTWLTRRDQEIAARRERRLSDRSSSPTAGRVDR